jgi:hypothetical protein
MLEVHRVAPCSRCSCSRTGQQPTTLPARHQRHAAVRSQRAAVRSRLSPHRTCIAHTAGRRKSNTIGSGCRQPRRYLRRSIGVSPPHTPSTSFIRIAYSRQSSRTSHRLHTCFACHAVEWSPLSPKNRFGSEPRHAACCIQAHRFASERSVAMPTGLAATAVTAWSPPSGRSVGHR